MAANEESSASISKATMLGALIGAVAGATAAVLAGRRRREETEPVAQSTRDIAFEPAMRASAVPLNVVAGGGMSEGTAGGGQSGGGTAGGGQSGGGLAGGGLSGGGT
jgi:hypothetical protein